MIRSLLGKKIPFSRLAVTVGLGSSLLAFGNASAQQVSDPASAVAPETASSERVIVTGSNIPSSEEVGFSPVDTIDQRTRDRTGSEDVLGVLNRSNPAISSGGGSLGQANASIATGATLGGAAVTIHGLPTLVLLDGRRLTDASAAAAGGGTFTDVNLFPSALVKRIEVLKDGASAIYGTEAIGGVINVILDQEFQGFDFSTRFGFTEKSDVKNERYSGIVGFGDDKTHIVIGAEYVNQDPLFTRQRANLSTADYDSGPFATGSGFVTTTAAGIVRLRSTATSNSPALFVLAPGLNSPSDTTAPGSVPLPVAGAPLGATGFPAGTYLSNAASPVPALNQINLGAFTGITLDQNRFNVFASADRQLIGNHVVAFVDFLYASNYSQSYLAAQPLSNNTGVIIPAGAPFNPFAGTIDGTNSTAVVANNRFVTNPRIFRNDADFYRLVAGFKGEIIKDVNYEVALNTSRDELTFKNPNLVIASDLNDAIRGGFQADGSAQVAGLTVNPATGVPYTVNGPFSVVRGNLQPALDFFARSNPSSAVNNFFGDNIRYILTKFAGVDGKITAFPFKLPAGPVGFAAGGEYRHESIKLQDSPEVFVGSVPVGDIDVGRDEFAGFAEVQIPLVSPDMKIPGIYRADIDGAGRFENYSNIGSAWVPKVGFTLLPIQDIALRGSFSKSFIAPTLYQTQGPSSNGFTSSYNIGGGTEQAQSLSGSNPNLASTRADTYTAGIVISPHQVPGFTANLDFFHVEESRIIGSFDPVTALNSVNNFGPASPFSQLVHRGSFGGPTDYAVGEVAGNGPTTFVTTQTQNLGRARIGGLDFGLHYTHDFGNIGEFSLGVDGTYYLQYKISTFANTPTYDIIGFYQGTAATQQSVEQYHLTPSVGYRIAGFSAEAIGNYIPSFRDTHNLGAQGIDPNPAVGVNADKPNSITNGFGQSYFNKIRDYYTIDLLFSYEFHYNAPVSPVPAPKDGKDAKGGGMMSSKETPSKYLATDSPLKLLDGLKFQFGIQNVTNARPPLIVGAPDSTNTDATIYDPYQRQYYFVLSKKF